MWYAESSAYVPFKFRRSYKTPPMCWESVKIYSKILTLGWHAF